MTAKDRRYPLWALWIGLLFLLIWVIGLLPPILEHLSCGNAADSIRSGYRLLCHGIPDRCPLLFGRPAAVCLRCSGIYVSLFLGCSTIFPLLRYRPGWRTVLITAALATSIMGLQWVLEFTGITSPSILLQVGTGFVWGTGLSLLFCRSIDILRELSRIT